MLLVTPKSCKMVVAWGCVCSTELGAQIDKFSKAENTSSSSVESWLRWGAGLRGLKIGLVGGGEHVEDDEGALLTVNHTIKITTKQLNPILEYQVYSLPYSPLCLYLAHCCNYHFDWPENYEREGVPETQSVAVKRWDCAARPGGIPWWWYWKLKKCCEADDVRNSTGWRAQVSLLPIPPSWQRWNR